MGGHSLPFRRLATALIAVVALALFSSAAAAQTAVFTGKVTSQAGAPLGGASVGIPELGVGGITDENGNYTFTVEVVGRSGRTANVMARYIGYKPKRLPVTLSVGRVQHDFVLEKDILNLEEVVVTGTSDATEKKKTAFSVGTVDNTQIKEVPSSSPLGAIQGKIPGAAVITSSGQPGTSPSIRLRAATSLTGRQDPLVIVDGTITRLSLADINSEDIDRIEIIKGAAASSLYGSDAANGVIQIFTKRGQNLAEGQSTFTLRNEYGANYLPRVLDNNLSHNYKVVCGAGPCTSADASTSKVTGFDLSSGGRTGDDDLIADNRYPIYYDQLRKVFRPGQFMTNYGSLGQRRGASNFNVSFENQHDAGVLRLLSGFRRQNFRMNIDQALSDNFDVGAGAFYGRSTADQAEDTGIFFGLRFLEPNVNIDSIISACPPGTTCSYVGQFNPVIRQLPLSGNVDNPLYDLQVLQRTNDRDRFTGTFRTAYRPMTWLTAEANVGYDEANRNYKSFTPVGYTNSSGGKSTGDLYSRSQNDRSYNANVSLTSVRELTPWMRNTTKLAGLYEDQTNNFTEVRASQLTVGKVTEFSAADLSQSIFPGSRTEVVRAKNAFVVSTFDIKDRYIIDGLVRQDQSSLFGSKERTSTYHRVSGAWRVSEDFAIPNVDEFKLRVSHGTAGLRPPFQAQYEVYTIAAGKPVKSVAGNSSLKPAYSTETEYGFNANFLKNYSLEYTYSKKRTTDEIIRVPLSAATGFGGGQYQNAGTLEGKSHEVAVGAVLLSKADYFWRLNLTGDRTRQKVTDLKVAPFLVGPNENDANTQIFRIATGQPFGVIYGSRWIRTQAQLEETIRAGILSGAVTDYTLNEEGFYVRNAQYHTKAEVPLKAYTCESATTCASPQSVVQIGDVNPDFNIGLNSTAQWKALTFSGTLTWVKGGNIYNYTRQWPFNELRDPVIDQSSKPAAGPCAATWQTTDPTCPYTTGKKPTSYYSAFYNNFDANDYFVEDGSYMRLRELAINWALPQKWLTRAPGGVRSARLGIVGRNLWTSTDYSGYDPDVTGPGGGNPFAYRVDYFTYPAYRQFTAMLELGF